MANKYSLKTDGGKSLSAHFKVKESACAGSDIVLADGRLVTALEKMIGRLGSKGGRVSDGYRTASYNKAIGGASNSRHLYGEAADISFFYEGNITIPAEKTCIEAEKLGLKGIEMINSSYAHLDTRDIKWFAIQGARTYKTIGSFIEYLGQPGAVSPTLRLGDSGGAVKKMQEAVKAKADGIFGRATKAALKAFQLASGLPPDGVCGPKTWAAIDKAAMAVKIG